MRISVALALYLALGVHLLLPVTASAGGRRPVASGSDARGGFRVPGRAPVVPGPPTGAFGSPGGFPLPMAASGPRSTHVLRRQIVNRLPRHTSLSWVAPPIGLYAPAIQYVPAVEPVPPAITVSPVIYASPTIYVSQPSVAQPDPVVAAAPPENYLPRVVEHPTGRYELRGDGTSTPHVWVWVPHPPPAPPEVVPSSEAPGEPVRAIGRTHTYRWTDEAGTMFVTNRLERVPEPYRPRTREPAN